MAVLKQEQKINLTTKKQHPRLRSMKDFYRKLKRNKAALVGGYLILFLTIVSLIGPYFLSNGINDVDYTARLQPPSAEYWLGTDQHGRDIFSRIIYGGQITLIVGFLSVALGGLSVSQ